MKIPNYLGKERVHYSVSLREARGKSFQMWEHIDGMNKNYKTMIGISYSWRAEILQKFLDRLIQKYHEDLKKKVISYQTVLADEGFVIDVTKTQWNHEYNLNNEIAMKILFSIKLISAMERRPRIEEALEIIYSLSDEEISFWAWKVLSLKTSALNGFKAMYL